MESKKFKGSKIIISVSFLVAMLFLTFYFLFKKFEFKDIFGIIKNADEKYILFAFLMVLVYLTCYGITMKVILNSVNNRISLFKSLLYSGIDFYFSAITPSASGGQPFVIYYMTKDGIPASHASFASILHTAAFKAVLIFLNIFGFIFYGSRIMVKPVFTVLWVIGLVISSVLLIVCLLSMFRTDLTLKIGRWLIKKLGRLHLIKAPDEKTEKFKETLREYKDAAVYLKGNPVLVIKIILTVLVQRTAYFSVAYFVYKSFGLSGSGYFYFLFVQSMIALAVDSLPIPGGVGVNEFATLLIYGKTFGVEQSASGMLLIRFINYYFCLVLCSIAAITAQAINAARRRRRDKK